MQGSEKQIKWATEIQRDALEVMNSGAIPALPITDAIRAIIASKTDAKWFIDVIGNTAHQIAIDLRSGQEHGFATDPKKIIAVYGGFARQILVREGLTTKDGKPTEKCRAILAR